MSNGDWLELSTYKCKDYLPQDQVNSRTREKCWEEQKQAAREKKDRIRFCITTVIGVITALAVVVTAIMTWRTP